MSGEFVANRVGLFGNWVNTNPELKVNRTINFYYINTSEIPGKPLAHKHGIFTRENNIFFQAKTLPLL